MNLCQEDTIRSEWCQSGNKLKVAGCGSSTPTLMRENSKRLQMGWRSSIMMTMAGPDMKSRSSSTTILRRLERSPIGYHGSSLSSNRGKYPLSSAPHSSLPRTPIRGQHAIRPNCSELPMVATTTAPHRGGSCLHLPRNRRKTVLDTIDDTC